MLSWIPYAHYADNGALLRWSGEFYTKIFSYIFNATRSVQVLTREHNAVLREIVVRYLKCRFSHKDFESSLDFEGIYEYLKSHKLLEIHLSDSSFFIRSDNLCNRLNDYAPEVKEFFVKAGCLGDWTVVDDSFMRYKIINEVNENIYSREGITNNLVFRACSLRKIISLNDGSVHIFSQSH